MRFLHWFIERPEPRPVLVWMLRWSDGKDYGSAIELPRELDAEAIDDFGEVVGALIATTIKARSGTQGEVP